MSHDNNSRNFVFFISYEKKRKKGSFQNKIKRANNSKNKNSFLFLLLVMFLYISMRMCVSFAWICVSFPWMCVYFARNTGTQQQTHLHIYVHVYKMEPIIYHYVTHTKTIWSLSWKHKKLTKIKGDKWKKWKKIKDNHSHHST